jgi:pimeloyl-ACP methyl ester carboxylesterase
MLAAVVWGQRDRCFTPALGRRLAGLFSNGNLIEVSDAKTFVALDQPDVVMNAIAKITAGKPGTARQGS